MDLSDLRTSLFLKDIKVSIRDDGGESLEGNNVALDIIHRHRNSTQEESKYLVVVLEAILETLKVEGMKPSATAVFASLFSFMEKEGGANSAISAACCNALSMVLVRVPVAVVRSKCVHCTKIIMGISEKEGSNPAVMKAAIACLGQLVAASGPNDWAAISPAYNLIISRLLDPHPKVRKKAQTAMVEIFAAFQEEALSGVLDQASSVLVQISQQILSGPERTAQEAARSSNKGRKIAEENIRTAVSNALRFMGTLKQIIHLVPEQPAQQLCSQILSLYHLQQALLTSSGTEIFLILCTDSGNKVHVKTLEELLNALLSVNSLWNTSDATLEMSVIRLLENLTLSIQHKGGDLRPTIAKIFHILVPQLASRIEGVARGSALAMSNIIKEAVTDELIAAASTSDGKKPAAILSIVSAIESAFGVQYFDSWELSLSVAQDLIAKLGRRGSFMASGLIEKIGELCAGVEDIAAADSGEIARISEIAQNTLGVCIRSLGPEIVLDHLPLEIIEALEGQAEGRTWMIPLLKIHMRGGRLGFWLDYLYPLIVAIEERRVKAQSASEHSKQACTLLALELQLWSTLPSFSSWAEDIPAVFRDLTKVCGPYFEQRQDIRLYISQTIQKISSQTRQILVKFEIEDGFADPCTRDDFDIQIEGEDDDMDEDAIYVAKFSDSDGPDRRAALKKESKIWLPLLLNAFVGTHSSKRNHIQCAISSYSCLCDQSTVNAVFKSAMMRLMKVANQLKTGELGKDAVFDGGDSDTERYCTYLEAIYSLLGGLDTNGLQIVYEVASSGIKEKDPAVQKKAYKILHYMIEDRPDFNELKFEEMIELMLDAASTAVSASRGFRIKCLKSTILHLLGERGASVDVSNIASVQIPTTDIGSLTMTDRVRLIMTPMVSEIVLSIKESNKKTRAAAFDLIIEVANAMDQSDADGGVVSLVHLIIGGLVGSTSQMVSASVMALARLLFEFTPNMMPMIHDLLPAILMLLRSKAREVIKAVLGFLKVAVMRLDSDILREYAPKILEGTLIWAEDSKNKFRLKVRVILERLSKKVGFEILQQNIPESHKSLLTHIRKQMGRKDRNKAAKSEMDWDGQSFAETMHSRGTRSRAGSKDPSAWQSDVFSDDTLRDGSKKAKSLTGFDKKSTKASLRSMPGKTNHTVLSESKDPLNLLDPSTSRRMVGMNIRKSGHVEKERKGEDEITFAQDDQGRLIINEESKDKQKRGRDDFLDGFDSDDSDIEDIKSIHGAHLALKGAQSIAKASSYAGTIHSRAGKRKQNERGSHHSGDRFKAKSKGTGGDVKGKSAIEPYAYWPLDRKMLNRRQQKTKSAKQGLDKVVNAAKEGALKGRKAKRHRSS